MTISSVYRYYSIYIVPYTYPLGYLLAQDDRSGGRSRFKRSIVKSSNIIDVELDVLIILFM